jgi:hypothetical protein
MPDFPVLDAPRPVANAELGRVIIDFFDYLEPHIEELDDWISLPLRLIYSQADGFGLELGPYTLGRADIERLRAAIAAYDQASGPQEDPR